VNHTAPWCEVAQKALVGFKNAEDERKMDIISIYKEGSHDWEDTRVGYSPEGDGNVMFNISGHNKQYGTGPTGVKTSCLSPAKEIGCKMASADRVA